MSFHLEAEIKALIEEHNDLEIVAESLIQNFQEAFIANPTSKLHAEAVAELCRFLLNCGLHQVLVRFCLRHVTNELFPVPWIYFIEAVSVAGPVLNLEMMTLIRAGIEADEADSSVAFAKGAHHFIDDPAGMKSTIKKDRAQQLVKLRQRLRDEVLTLKAQQLFDQEKSKLIRLQKIFPRDAGITADLTNHRERRAMDILSRHSPLGRAARVEESKPSSEMLQVSEGLKESFQITLTQTPAMAFDFAVAAYMMEDFETCAEILDHTELSLTQVWFHLEVKLKCRRFLEVLQDLTRLEIQMSSEPETFFATAYLRAQAYWGLHQKHTAIEILENLLSVRPHYRSGATLLDLWRTQ